MDAARCWEGRRNGASNGVMEDVVGAHSSDVAARRTLSRGGMAVVVGYLF